MMSALPVIAAVLGYLCVAVGFFLEVRDDGDDETEAVLVAIGAVLWPGLLLFRIGQWIASPGRR